MHLLNLLLITLFIYASPMIAEETFAINETIQFIPPTDWRNADKSKLPEHVHLMVVGQGANEFPPSISLATEKYSGTLKQYLKVVKELNSSKGYEWRDLGSIQTDAGNASLSQTTANQNGEKYA